MITPLALSRRHSFSDAFLDSGAKVKRQLGMGTVRF